MTSYKQTELGLIPSDWEVVALGDVGSVEMCKRIFKYQTKNIGDIPFYKIGTFGNTPDAYISKELFEEYKNKYPYPKKGDVLISAAGTIGRTVIFLDENSYYQDSNIVWLHINKEKISNEFLNYIYQNIIWNSLEGSTIKRLYNSDLLSKLIPLPPKPEQTAIATALSDTDALITELEKLLAKKQAIKTATMQQLLAGKTRLPEFAHRADGTPKGSLKTEWGDIPEDWEVVALGDIGQFGRGRVISHIEINKSIGNLYPVYSSQTTNHGIMGFLDTFDFSGEYITWTTDGVNAGKVFYRNGKFNCTNVCGIIKISEQYNTKFISLAMGRESRKYVSTNLANPKLMNGVAKSIQIIIPKSTTEQTAIAQILGDMDSEITALQAQIEKLREIKQGMMQNLLTGKIRLPC